MRDLLHFQLLFARVFERENDVNSDAQYQNRAQRQPESPVEFAAQNLVENDASPIARRPADQRLEFDLLEYIF